MATSPTPDAKAHSLLRLTLMGLLSGIISALIAATTMLALSDYQFFGGPHVGEVAGSAAQNFAEDLPTALVAAFFWYIPIGTFVFPPLAKLIGTSAGNSCSGCSSSPDWQHSPGFWLAGSFTSCCRPSPPRHPASSATT